MASDAPTVVSLNPCTDAILAEIAPANLLAISHYSHDPRSSSMDLQTARRFPATGGTVEEVLALNPDVVVGSTFMAPATRAAFDDLDIRVEPVGIAASLEDSVAQVRQLADITEARAQGEALVQRMQRAWSDAAGAGEPVQTVLWQPGGIVPGDGALVSRMMEQAGLASHSAARGLQQADYLPLEAMLADPPELLLVAGRERSQQHPAIAAINDMRTEAFDASLLYCGGPTIIRAMERLGEVRAEIATPPASGRGAQ
ncbi:ABC transporter substrate-binding protein [Qipengyuania sp. DSG2-2]|uniref:ABC transporter substrate-binding protein n=1 Tax=Qipengyuania sp. DGS2-2 TaxID=3349631 RepID=UPI0036D3E343